MAKAKATFFEQVPLAVVKNIAGADLSVNHAVAGNAKVASHETSKARRPATIPASRHGGKRDGKL